MKKVLAIRNKLSPRLGPKHVHIHKCDVTQEMVQSCMVSKRVVVYWDKRTGRCPSPTAPAPSGLMLWDSENEECYDAEIGPTPVPVWDEDEE